jgi:hypothetical protein
MSLFLTILVVVATALVVAYRICDRDAVAKVDNDVVCCCGGAQKLCDSAGQFLFEGTMPILSGPYSNTASITTSVIPRFAKSPMLLVSVGRG